MRREANNQYPDDTTDMAYARRWSRQTQEGAVVDLAEIRRQLARLQGLSAEDASREVKRLTVGWERFERAAREVAVQARRQADPGYSRVWHVRPDGAGQWTHDAASASLSLAG